MKRRIGKIMGYGLLALCPCLVLGAASSPAASAERPATAASLLAAAMANAGSAGWVHEVTVNVGEGHRISMHDDIGMSSGRQVIDDNGGHMTVVVMGGIAYVDANAKALERDLGAPSRDATVLAGRWLSIPPGNQMFPLVSDAVTLESDFSQHRLSGPLKRGSQVRIDGTPSIPITGTLYGAPHHERISATLYVSAANQPLPLEFRASGHGVSTRTRWTDWGRAVVLNTPSGALSLGNGGGSGSA